MIVASRRHRHSVIIEMDIILAHSSELVATTNTITTTVSRGCKILCERQKMPTGICHDSNANYHIIFTERWQ